MQNVGIVIGEVVNLRTGTLKKWFLQGMDFNF